jgi:glucose-6-phosphate isomerase
MLQLNFDALEAVKQPEMLPSLLLKSYAEPVKSAVQQLVDSRNKPGAWTDWLNLTSQSDTVAHIEAMAHWARHQFTDMVVLGIGGSSLGGFALIKALCHPYWNQLPEGKRDGWLRYHFIENVDADQIHAISDVLNLEKTLFVVITKSGSTAETMSALVYFQTMLQNQLGDGWKDHLVAITDPQKGLLRQLVTQWGIRSLPVPADVGGRFSVFSAVGLLPAALCGLDIKRLLAGVQAIEPIALNPDINVNLAAQGAAIQVAFDRAGKKQSVFMPYSARLASVADWYVQLWAESLGKRVNRQGDVVHAGQTPVKAVGVTDQHSQVQLFNEGPLDKLVTFVEVIETDHQVTIPDNTLDGLAYLGNKTFHQLMLAELHATRQALLDNGRPSWTIVLPSITPESVAQLLFMLQVQTALAGFLMDIDPFDQPGVEQGKLYTYALMGRQGYEQYLPKQPVAV